MSDTSHSFFDNFSDHLQSTVGQQAQGLSQLKIENAKMNSNKNLSGETKTVANVLDAVDAGVQAFGLVTGAVDGVVESALVTALSGLGLKGMACLPVAIQLSPVLGIDIHFVNIPPSPAPVPMPHPYMGILLRPKDFLSAAILSLIPPPPEAPDVEDPDNPTEAEQQALNLNKAVNLAHTLLTMKLGNLGASVLIGGLPRVVAGTPTINIPHVPMGAGFHAVAAGIQKNKGHAYMGSLNVLADGDPLSGGGAHLHMNCCDVGIPSPHTAGQVAKHKEVPTGIPVYLPTGVINPIPMSKQVLTNPVPTPLNPISFFSGKIKSSFGRLFKKKKDKTNKIPTSAADSMGGRISQRGKDNKVIRSDAVAFIPKKKVTTNTGTETRNRRPTGAYNPFGEVGNDGYRRGVEHIEANTRNIDEASFTRENIDRIEKYLSTDPTISNEGRLWENNEVMINRARAIERGELEATDKDKAFLTHELRESELRETGMGYEEAHAQTCKEYGIKANEEKNAFYTEEADMALYNADLNRY